MYLCEAVSSSSRPNVCQSGFITSKELCLNSSVEKKYWLSFWRYSEFHIAFSCLLELQKLNGQGKLQKAKNNRYLIKEMEIGLILCFPPWSQLYFLFWVTLL